MNKHINPQFRRKDIRVLDGIWDFAFDKKNEGDIKGYRYGFNKEYDIKVPFAYSSKLSGVDIQEPVDVTWYQNKIEISEADLTKDIYLCFEGVDDICSIYLNGRFVGSHRGGNTSFRVLLNGEAKVGKNLIVIKAEDDLSISKARGKQRWQNYNFGCWYTQTSGIYRSVYLELVNHVHINYLKIIPHMENATVDFDYIIDNFVEGLELEFIISYHDMLINKVRQIVNFDSGRISVDLNSPCLDYQAIFWAPHDPHLYDLTIKLIMNNKIIDEADSYFGICEYRVSSDNVLLNGFSYISKMVLYQGYSKDGLLTPKDDEEIIKDINNIKSMGFNGIRCHQYIPSERFLYLCDLYGLSVWIEYPSQYLFNIKAQDIILNEWRSVLKAKHNHPCVFAYVIYNESWGIRGISTNKEEQSFVEVLYHLTKSFDEQRIVVSNDGWEHVKSDILTIHNYCQDPERLEKMFLGGKHLYHHRDNFAKGYEVDNLPVFLTEYGGCSIGKLPKDGKDWGYGEGVNNLDEFYELLTAFQKMIKNVGFKGYCYTQYRDVQQEKNGFADEDGNLKVDPKRIREIIDKIY